MPSAVTWTNSFVWIIPQRGKYNVNKTYFQYYKLYIIENIYGFHVKMNREAYDK